VNKCRQIGSQIADLFPFFSILMLCRTQVKNGQRAELGTGQRRTTRDGSTVGHPKVVATQQHRYWPVPFDLSLSRARVERPRATKRCFTQRLLSAGLLQARPKIPGFSKILKQRLMNFFEASLRTLIP